MYTSHQNKPVISADELYKEPRREHRGRQGRPRKHDISTPRSDKKLASSESLRSDKPRGHSKAGPASLHSESMYQFQGSTYKTSTLPQGGTMVSVDTDCMIFYDNTSDAGSIHSMPVPSTHSHPTTRAHIMPHHLNHKSDLHLSKHSSATIDKKIHAFRNLEDSGIDVKSPPQVPAQQTSHPQRNGALQSTGKERPGGSSCDAEVMRALQSQNSFLSPTLSDSSPFSLSGGTEVKRSGSFSSMKSLPVNMYKDNSTPNSFTFETIDHRDDLRSKSQSCTNLTRTKVVRRRSLPPLDVSQEKLEQKKTSLSKRLARKINRYRENEKRYPVLPSPHSFSTQNTKKPPDPDDMSLADMEVAHILEGKPEHPTDSDVEDYLACVESAEPQTTAKSKKTSKPHKDTVQQQSEDMEKSGYYRYRNSAKLERQQKQDTAELTQSDTHSKGEVTKENPQTHKPKSLNKFVDQSMKSFLHHCHDVNMVSKHDTLELHQAALHGVLPTSPSAQTHNPLEARSPTKVTDSHNMKSRHSPTKSHTHYSAKRPTELHTTGLLPQSPTKTADHQSPLKSPNTQKHSPVRTSLTSSRTSAYKSPSDSPLKNSTKAYVQSPTKSVAQNSAKSSIQSPTKPPSQSPTKTLPQSPAKVAEYLSLDKPLHSISERDSYPVHNSTKASGYSSTSHMIHGSQNRSGSLHTQSESSSKGNQRTVAQIQMSAPHPSNESKVLTHIVDNIRNAKIASKYAVEDRLEINTSKTDDIHKHSDTSVSDPQEVSTKNQHMERIVQDIPDGSVNSKKYSLHVTHNGNRENQKDTNAFNCKGSYYQSQSTDGLKKMHNESHTDSQTVFEELENQSNHQTQSQYLYSCDSIPDKVQHSSGSHVKSGVTSAQMNSQEIVTLPGAVREVNTSTSQCGQQKIDVSDCKSNGSRPPPYSVDGGEGVVLKSLNLFSLVSSHMLCAVYLEKTTGQSYGICVRRGEFRETRQAWHVEDTPVYSVVQITELQPQSPAQASKGKLLPGDIIVEVSQLNEICSEIVNTFSVVQTCPKIKILRDILVTNSKNKLENEFIISMSDNKRSDNTATLHKLAAAHLQAPERQIGYCTPMKTVAYNNFNNNTWFPSVVGHSC